ncbi:uncharacterized protein LOC135123750 [Zophobas morio]|uniref:uncharacterized protein LOC135123750 n=1 Tax=Zophobas morio TaxID=2755281 RepID=UPI003083D57A
MRRLNSDFSDKSTENWKTPYLEIVAVGTIQFFLALLIMCYGVFLMQFILKDLYSLKSSLWTAIFFVSSAKITNPWVKSYCKHLDNVKLKVHKRNIIVTVLLLFNDLVVLSFYKTTTSVFVLYGIFGGIFSSIITVHLNYLTSEAFKHHPQLFTFLDQLMKALSLLLLPHLTLLFTNVYGTTQSFLIIAGLILNIIPACLLIHHKTRQKKPLCRFQTVDQLSIEMTDLSSKQPVVQEPSSSSEDEDDDDDDDDNEDEDLQVEESESDKPAPVSSMSVQRYFQNVGVKILPNIPEESDAEEDDDDINEISSKRLSRISAILQEINDHAHKDVNLSVTNLFQPEEVCERVETDNVEVEFLSEASQKKARCFSISSSFVNDVKAKKRKLKAFCYKNFVKAVPRTLGCGYFYPAVVSNCVTSTSSAIVFAAAPYFMFLHNEHEYRNYPNTTEEATFLLTLIGFSWIFFLAGYPVFNKLSAFKTKALFLVGLSVLGFSLYVVHKFSYDNFVLFSLTFGLGHGIIMYAESIANEEFFGEAKWQTMRGALEISTGLLVILIYSIIYFCNFEIYVLLSYAYWFYIFDVGLWIVAYVTKKIFVYCKNRGRYNVQNYPDFDF